MNRTQKFLSDIQEEYLKLDHGLGSFPQPRTDVLESGAIDIHWKNARWEMLLSNMTGVWAFYGDQLGDQRTVRATRATSKLVAMAIRYLECV